MEPEEQQAIQKWLIAKIAEHAGVARRERPSKVGCGICVGYRRNQWQDMFNASLPPALCERIQQLINKTPEIGYWDVWPQLTEAELGIIMQAGAAGFLIPVEAP